MTGLNQRLLKTLGLSWLTLLLSGLIIHWVLAVPTTVVLVDRSYCPDAQWQQVIQRYQDLYQQHRQNQLEITQVIFFSTLGEELVSPPPLPETLRQLPRYGRAEPQRQQQLKAQYLEAVLLTCP